MNQHANINKFKTILELDCSTNSMQRNDRNLTSFFLNNKIKKKLERIVNCVNYSI